MYASDLTPDMLHSRLASAVTQYDIKQERRRGYNKWALPQYLQAVDRTVTAVGRDGLTVERAILENFNGRLAHWLFRAIGMTGDELDRWTWLAR
jgi:hypothetical protein